MSGKIARGWGRAVRELPERDADANQTGVAYISVLFGIAFGQLATGSVKPVQAILNGDTTFAARHASATHYAVGLVLTLTSFVGYFASKNGPQLRIKFFNLPFLTIVLDSAMVILYFFVAVDAEDGTQGSFADARPEAILVFLSFVFYVCWDYVGLWIRRDPYSQLALGRAPANEFGYRRWVTVSCCAVAALMAYWVSWIASPHPTERVVMAWDVALIVLLIVYRVLKSFGDTDIVYRGEARADVTHTPAAQSVPAADWERIVPSAVRDDRAQLEAIVANPGLPIAEGAEPATERLRDAGAVTIRWNGERTPPRRPKRVTPTSSFASPVKSRSCGARRTKRGPRAGMTGDPRPIRVRCAKRADLTS